MDRSLGAKDSRWWFDDVGWPGLGIEGIEGIEGAWRCQMSVSDRLASCLKLPQALTVLHSSQDCKLHQAVYFQRFIDV